MNKLKVGIIWLLITGFVIFAMYGGLGPGGTLTVNGEIVTQEQFNALLWPKIFFGLFLLIGLWMLFSGVKEQIIKTKTDIHGKESYGLITDIIPTGTYVRGRPELKADILVVTEDNQIKTFTKIIGFHPIRYSVGTYVSVKCYGNNINIVNPVLLKDIPETIRLYLCSANNFVTPVNNISSINDWNIETYSLNGVKHSRKKHR